MSSPVSVTTQNFQSYVLENPLPVLVDFWADWCEPCKMLAPVLDTLAADYDGRAVVAKVNVDEENQIAAAAGIRSLPTLMVFVDGQPVDQIVGVQPEANIRAVLEKHLGDTPEKPAPKLEPDAGSSPEATIAQLQALLEEDPGNVEALAAIARIHIMNSDLEAAQTLVDSVAEDDQGKPEIAQIRAALFFAKLSDSEDSAANQKPFSPELPLSDLRAGGIQAVAQGNHDDAAECFLAILGRDRSFADDFGRAALLQLIDLLGPEDERVGQIRRRMMTLIY